MPEKIDITDQVGRQTRDALAQAVKAVKAAADKASGAVMTEMDLKREDPRVHQELRRIIDEQFGKNLGDTLPRAQVTGEPVQFAVQMANGGEIVWTFDHSGNRLMAHELAHVVQQRR